MLKGAPFCVKPGIPWVTYWVEVSLSSDGPSSVLRSRPLPGRELRQMLFRRLGSNPGFARCLGRGGGDSLEAGSPLHQRTLLFVALEEMGGWLSLNPELMGSGLKVWMPTAKQLSVAWSWWWWWLGVGGGCWGHVSPATAVGLRHQPCESFAPGWASPIPGRLDREVSGFTADLQGKSGRGGIRW